MMSLDTLESRRDQLNERFFWGEGVGAENAGVEYAGVENEVVGSRGGKVRSYNAWKAGRRQHYKTPVV